MKSVFPETDERTLVFSKRLINDKLKRSFSVESCHSSFIQPLSGNQKSNLENYLTENPSILSKFDRYERPIDSILNLGLYCENEKSKKDIIELANGLFKLDQPGISNQEVGEIWKKSFSKYLNSSIRNMTLQFVSEDTTVIDEQLYYQQLNFLDF